MTQQPSYMSDQEFASFERGDITKIGDYTIKPKLDFGGQGHLIKGEDVDVGWVITKGGCLATPGGTWAATHDQAKRMIGALMAAKGDPDIYHGLMMLTKPKPDKVTAADLKSLNPSDFIPVTFEEVNSAIFEIYNYADRDPERAQGVRLNLHTRVLQAIGAGLCEDPVRCAALAASTDDINLKWE